ncbi:MAG: DUF542 domain-containing protein [Planctomycetaceae bacterium]|nr:DUF542 domain-containing protein [Planctomycetaceae bacterium]
MTVQTVSIDMPIGRIVLDYPQTRPLFEKLRIDYACCGQLSLRRNAEAAGIDPGSIILQIEGLLRDLPAPVFADLSLADLCCKLVNGFHRRLKHELPDLKCLLCKLRQSCSGTYLPMLKRLSDILDDMTELLELHMLTQEQDLFPQVARLESLACGGTAGPQVNPADIEGSVSQLTRLHISTAEALSAIRDLTEDFSWLDRSSGLFCLLYRRLWALQDSLHEHIHYENNLLFPRAMDLCGAFQSQQL